MRPLRLITLLAGIGLLLLSVWSGFAGARERQRSDLDATLQRQAQGASLALEAYFERAQALTLLLSRNAAFDAFYEMPGTRLEKVRQDGAAIQAANDALGYVEQLYPNKIGEICFIDQSGAERARVVRGRHARAGQLSLDEAANPFFKPTFALRVGEMYQARPYISPDTHEWVISNSTVVPSRDGKKRAIVHFEVTVESVRRELISQGLDTRIVEGSTGAVVIDSSLPQLVGGPLGQPGDRSLVGLVRDEGRTGLLTVGGKRMAVARITRQPNNHNDWYVVVSAPGAAGFALGGVGWRSAALMLAALLTLGIAFLSVVSYQRELRRRALTDALTGLPNRTLFHDRARRAVLASRRGNSCGAVIILDLDRFKDVNDTLGHRYGDMVLLEVGRRLSACLRESDTLARLGGDEFAILLPEICDADGARVAVERLRATLDEPLVLEGMSVQVDSSFGIALFPEHGVDVETLVRRADIAMYEAKRLRSAYAFYATEQDPHSTRRLGMVAALKEAIEQRSLYLHYQPKIDLQTGKVRGVEALARWEHPTLGPIEPSEFISVAEDTGLIRPLTLFVLDEALRQTRAWMDAGLDLRMSINISARDLFDPHLVDAVADALARHRVPAEQLTLEITEGTVMIEPERAMAALELLRGMKISLSVDDYGTGHSALAYLKNLPVNEIKLDRSFVMNMATDATDALIVRSTIDLGRSLGLSVVAEGVEDEATLRHLTALGCPFAQGFYISRPLSAAELERWVDHLRGGREPDAPAARATFTDLQRSGLSV